MAKTFRGTIQRRTPFEIRNEGQSSAQPFAADINFSSIVGLDAAGGWHVLQLSAIGEVSADAAALRVLHFFFPHEAEWRGDLPGPLSEAFLETKNWGMTRTPRAVSQNLRFEREAMKLSAILISNTGIAQIILRVTALNSNASALVLTGRELDIAALVAAGKTNIEIGMVLSISARTVQKHMENIFRKLGVETRMALAMRLITPQ